MKIDVAPTISDRENLFASKKSGFYGKPHRITNSNVPQQQCKFTTPSFTTPTPTAHTHHITTPEFRSIRENFDFLRPQPASLIQTQNRLSTSQKFTKVVQKFQPTKRDSSNVNVASDPINSDFQSTFETFRLLKVRPKYKRSFFYPQYLLQKVKNTRGSAPSFNRMGIA